MNPYRTIEEGEALFSEKRYAEALIAFMEAVAILDGEVHNGVVLKMGACLFYMGELKPALNYLDKALEVEPDHFGGLGLRGIAYTALQRYEDALKDYSKIKQLGYGPLNKEKIDSSIADCEKEIREAEEAKDSGWDYDWTDDDWADFYMNDR